ncbi:bifunctional 4-hydroxy-2-oxoglutarate aldolase/2-dehydro-3-deoxy-phosphogluconate aldolase [Fusibacter ferrireducens]|uniref:Bifunctional 4-hydroxy-2-oxoglutarate aldolase/2-dehydro-3-deoxy-phosphogluconate aldolase n=1 Tax=Fusibacter ferrireducens TaxID=2785058 RepID=A0ABS0A0K0_9FIRM|nr:bifunctional 4-hydroxy-2-oxoglutarate aldolase/2-dehydro-3-deoxy-phosphogluconate aldolase [Fusibacter ferrireducens]MBF4695776.1 bifunctional 4-hydroxy-2-oxoglutarate aldolase/2-dehydro-3-deoxy-phosphogluconate aldolase [Fusibacter ferrireducens]
MKTTVKEFPKITAILRGYSFEETELLLTILSGSKIKAVEIALNTPKAKEILRALIPKYSDQLIIGAGTVTNMNDLRDVIDAGVDFVLSPIMMTKEMLDYCKAHHVISVPGAYSPTEIHTCFSKGADLVKVFPAVNAGSSYFKNVMSALGHLPLMAVGGVDQENVKTFFESGASFVGISSALFKKNDVEAKRTEALKKSIILFADECGL